jgi:hypothetical protein
MTERQFRLLTDLAILSTAIAIALIVLSPSGSVLAGGDWGRRLSQAQTWVVHGLMFGGLGFVIALRVASSGRSLATLAKIIVAMLLLALLGGLVEAAQLGVDTRSASYGDWMGDTIGAAMGLWIGAGSARPLLLRLTHR